MYPKSFQGAFQGLKKPIKSKFIAKPHQPPPQPATDSLAEDQTPQLLRVNYKLSICLGELTESFSLSKSINICTSSPGAWRCYFVVNKELLACKPSVLLAPGRKRLWGGPLQEQAALGVAQVRVGKS